MWKRFVIEIYFVVDVKFVYYNVENVKQMESEAEQKANVVRDWRHCINVDVSRNWNG